MSQASGAVLLCLLVSAATHIKGLHFSMDRTPDATSCARLKCLADVEEDKDNIQSIIGLRIYKVTLTNRRFKLVSMSVFDPGPDTALARSHVIDATGEVTLFHGDLRLELRDESDCLYGSFVCELNFVNVSGQPRVMREEAVPEQEKLGSLLLARLAARIEVHTAKVDNEVTYFKDQTARMEGKFDDEVTYFKNQTSRMESKFDDILSRIYRLEEFRNVSYQIPQLDRCYKGMSRGIAREKIILWNNVEALCNTKTDGGGWIVIQRRAKGDVNFYRNWAEYKKGFGNVSTDYWLGNDIINNLTSLGYNELRVDLKKDNIRYFAHYTGFYVGDATANYKLTVGTYDGTASDALKYHNNQMFSTFDRDNDRDSKNCASTFTGAWWYNECYHSNLNGLSDAHNESSIAWNNAFVKTPGVLTEMMIRQG